MGIFGRMKRAVKSKANAAIDKAIDPAKELDMAILELEEQQKQAIKDLLSYKASAKAMEKDMAILEEKAKLWEHRAMTAVKKGDDELAKQCLKERKQALTDYGKVKADRDEAAGYAIELNRSRKRVDTQLQVLKLKKGTMATQIAAARSGTGNAFGFSNEVFERMDKAEEKIDSEAIQAEVDAAMDGEELGSSLDAKLLAAGADPAGGGSADDELARLKAKVHADRERKLLKK
ncbi:MAG TPA: PspA/IM30 family protein [Kofleriaceae bacterium]|jgi:phage shock protein A